MRISSSPPPASSQAARPATSSARDAWPWPGLALFAVASIVVATAPAPALLLAGRALQGLAAALAVPGTLAAINEASPPERRASAIGAWAGFLMLGFSLGPLIGGALTHYLDWRVIFWLSGAAMLAAAGGFIVPHAARGPLAHGTCRAVRLDRFRAARNLHDGVGLGVARVAGGGEHAARFRGLRRAGGGSLRRAAQTGAARA